VFQLLSSICHSKLQLKMLSALGGLEIPLEIENQINILNIILLNW